MYGQIDTSDLTTGHQKLQSVESKINPEYAIHWLICTLLTCIILMNLLIGLTLGDVGEIEKQADCQVVQIKLRKLYFRQVIWTVLLSPLYKLWKQEKNFKTNSVISVHPNKYREGCVVTKKVKLWARLVALWTATYIIGCSHVRKKILENFRQ